MGLSRAKKACPIPVGARRTTDKEGRPAVTFKNAKGQTITARLTKDGQRCLVPTGKYRGRYRDADGKLHTIPLSNNKEAARLMLDKLVREAEMARAGVRDPYTKHRTRPLSEHLTDFAGHLEARGVSQKHLELKLTRIRKILEGSGCQSIFDIDAVKVEAYLLATSKGDGTITLPPVPDNQELFTRTEVAQLLGVSLGAVTSMVKQHDLPVVGKGPARRFPRATLLLLRERKARGASIQTINHYLAAVKSFCRWLVLNKRLPENPLLALQGQNVATDLRHDRRTLVAEELKWIIEVALTSPRVFRGLTGVDRSMLYVVAMTTGFRAEELSTLTPASFDLDGSPPTVTLGARHAKNEKAVVQPIPPDVAHTLRNYLIGRPDTGRVWPGQWYERAVRVLRVDLEAAGIHYVTQGPDGPLYADFHALRHSFVVLLDDAGATLREAMTLARHSVPQLTLKRYGKLQKERLGQTVARLPNLLPGSVPEAQKGCTKVVTPPAADSGKLPDQAPPSEPETPLTTPGETAQNAPRVEIVADCGQLTEVGPAGVEPASAVYKTAALPLNFLLGKVVTTTTPNGCSEVAPPCLPAPSPIPSLPQPPRDPELAALIARLVERWSDLPEPIRAALRALVR